MTAEEYLNRLHAAGFRLFCDVSIVGREIAWEIKPWQRPRTSRRPRLSLTCEPAKGRPASVFISLGGRGPAGRWRSDHTIDATSPGGQDSESVHIAETSGQHCC